MSEEGYVAERSMSGAFMAVVVVALLAALGALILFVVVNLTFAPFLWGDRNMMSSSVDASSIFVTGATGAKLDLHPLPSLTQSSS